MLSAAACGFVDVLEDWGILQVRRNDGQLRDADDQSGGGDESDEEAVHVLFGLLIIIVTYGGGKVNCHCATFPTGTLSEERAG